MKKIEKSIKLGGRKLTLSTGHVAEQADAAVMVSYGDTVLLTTVVASELREDPGYLPLHVEYRERLYAGGRIKGSRWVKREGRPSDDEILTARLIDRSIRPLFSKAYRKEVQVIIAVLSVDLENTPDMAAGVAVSAALAISPIPWNGPVGMIKVGMKDGAYVTNPLDSELEGSKMELVVSSTKDAIVMIEAGSKEATEKEIIGGVAYAQKESRKVIKFVGDFIKEVGVKKKAVKEEKIEPDLQKKVKELAGSKIKDLIKDMSDVKAGYEDYDEIKSAIADSFEDEVKGKAARIFEDLFSQEVKKMILSGVRPDGRKPEEIRHLSAEVGILPRTHGSAIFRRGQTQVLSVTTLGAPSLKQLIESAEGEETKRYIHHYSMPPYSIGGTGRLGWPSRREIGHGALAERALLHTVPLEEEFPYTILVVSEILSSNGSTSMAATCGSTLSLMDAGVPIKSPIAGIAMGLVVESEKKFVVLTDIAGIEDGSGDMDFKIAGSAEGITSLQLDVKTLKLTLPILKKAFDQAKKARIQILKVMKTAISKPRESVSVYAPKIKVIKIPQDKIGEVIGPGGRTIRGIIAETGTQVDVEDDGSINISGTSEEGVASAVEKVEALVKEVQPGEIYEGEAKRIQPYGVFVEVLPGKEGLVHISDMSEDFVQDPKELVSLGDKVKVRVKEVDDRGRINLSMLLKGEKRVLRSRPIGKPGGPRSMSRRPVRRGPSGERFDRDRRRPYKRSLRDRSGQKRKPSGPHFPASRLLEQSKGGFSR